MAKGNDGNYLQHSIEVAVAVHLAGRSPHGCLHISLAHGMAPYETCSRPSNGQARLLLQGALQAASNPAAEGESRVVAAYRATNASLTHYPNTAELLRVTIREDRLTGGITEVDQKKYALLQEVWAGSGVRVANASWRSEMKRGGILWCPAFLDKTWLLTADPMTYREVGQSDDNNLYRADSNQLVDALKPFVASGHLGVGVLCVYGIRPRTQQQFWDFADEIVRQTGKEINITSCWVPHHGANRNLAAVLCSGFALPENWLPYGLNPGR